MIKKTQSDARVFEEQSEKMFPRQRGNNALIATDDTRRSFKAVDSRQLAKMVTRLQVGQCNFTIVAQIVHGPYGTRNDEVYFVRIVVAIEHRFVRAEFNPPALWLYFTQRAGREIF